MKHLGNLTVTKENALSFPAVTEFYGHLTIAPGAELRAPDLVSIRGWLTIGKDAGFAAPRLGHVDGWVNLQPESSIMAEHLTEIVGDQSSLTIGADVNLDFRSLRTIGMVILQRDAVQDLEELESCGGIAVEAHGALGAPKLVRVGRSITLRDGASLRAPLLTHIGGYYDGDETATLYAPRFGS